MSKLDDILRDDQEKRELKKLILDLFKEADYEPYAFVEKVEAL